MQVEFQVQHRPVGVYVTAVTGSQYIIPYMYSTWVGCNISVFKTVKMHIAEAMHTFC